MRENQDKSRSEELALAVSIILANLSSDEEFLKILLGVRKWKVVAPAKTELHMPGSMAGDAMVKDEMDDDNADDGENHFR